MIRRSAVVSPSPGRGASAAWRSATSSRSGPRRRPCSDQAARPIGADNDAWLARLPAESDLVVAAWGDHGRLLGRGTIVRAAMPGLHHLGLTRCGEPRHPLYLLATTEPGRWD